MHFTETTSHFWFTIFVFKFRFQIYLFIVYFVQIDTEAQVNFIVL